MIRVSEQEMLAEMGEVYRQAVSDTFSAVFDALLKLPEEMTAREAGELLKGSQADMEAAFVAEFDQKLAERAERL